MIDSIPMFDQHFFKAKSRIGILNKPIHQDEFNFGVENGPDVILEPDFLENSGFKVSEFEFPLPEDLSSQEFAEVLTRSIIDFRDFINSELKIGERQVVIGGDHSVTLPSVLALIQRIPDLSELGYIHFDSHGDINLYKESPTKNFHGMYLRPLVDKFDIPQINNLVPNKLPTGNMLFVGNLDLDFGEEKFFQDKKIKTISENDLLKNSNQVLEFFKEFINRFNYLHVSFDVDILDEDIFPATGIPAKNGFKLDDVKLFLELIKNHPNLSFDLAEFNPEKPGSEKSRKIVQGILKLVCA